MDKKKVRPIIAIPNLSPLKTLSREFLLPNKRPLNQLIRLLNNNGISYTYYRSSRTIVIDHGFKTVIRKEKEFEYWTCERLDYHSKVNYTVSFQANNQYMLLIKLLQYNLVPMYIANLLNSPKKKTSPITRKGEAKLNPTKSS